MTPDLFTIVFGPPSALPILPELRPDEQTIVFGGQCEPAVLLHIFESQALAVESYLDSLSRILVYSPSATIPAAVRHVWSAFGTCTQYLRSFIKFLLGDTRYLAMTPEAQGRRPCAFVTNAFRFEMLGSLLLPGCHRALLKKGGDVDGMLKESEDRLCRSLSATAEGVTLILVSLLPSYNFPRTTAVTELTKTRTYTGTSTLPPRHVPHALARPPRCSTPPLHLRAMGA